MSTGCVPKITGFESWPHRSWWQGEIGISAQCLCIICSIGKDYRKVCFPLKAELSALEPHAAFLSLTSETTPSSRLQPSGPPIMNCINASWSGLWVLFWDWLMITWLILKTKVLSFDLNIQKCFAFWVPSWKSLRDTWFSEGKKKSWLLKLLHGI